MTLDDLVKVYRNEIAKAQYPGWDEKHRAGVCVVVRALRGEMVRCHLDGQEFGFAGERTAMQGAEKFVAEIINEILANDGGVKAAGNDTTLTELEAIERSTPAADLPGEWGSRLNEPNAVAEIQMEPSVCEWTVECDNDGDGHYETQCGDGWELRRGKPRLDGYLFCPSCGSSVSFKEKETAEK